MENKNSLASNVRIGTGLVAWGTFRDRFAGYRDALPVQEAIRQAAAITASRLWMSLAVICRRISAR